MVTMEWTLEVVLVVLLGATLFQAIRLERALGILKRDRASLESLVVGFNTSTHQAESGIQRLRSAADGSGRQIEAQLVQSVALKDDLAFLTERGDRLADRLDALVRAVQPMVLERAQAVPQAARVGSAKATGANATSQVEQDLMAALRMAR
jgi:hypothetical protein